MTSVDYKAVMIIAAARRISKGNEVFVGMGLPIIVAMYAQKSHAPHSVLLNEYGIVDPMMHKAIEVADPAFGERSVQLCGMTDALGWLLRRADIAVLGAAQVDRYGNSNSTVIGDYRKPNVRIAGSGGANDIASLARSFVIIMDKQRPEKMPERVDYLTSPGFLDGPQAREHYGLPGGGPEAVYTDKAVYKFHPVTKELFVQSLHPGITLADVREDTGWKISAAPKLLRTPLPTPGELRLLRSLDPNHVYLD